MTDMEDDDLFDPLDEEDQEEAAPDPATAKELQELRDFKTQKEEAERALAISEVFKEVGVNPAAAKLWATLNDGDATPESVRSFADEYGLSAAKVGFTPTTFANTEAVPAKKKFSRDELAEIARQNPARAQQLAEAGKIQWSNDAINERPQR